MRTKKLQERKTFLCQSIKKREKNYFENLDTKNVSDNKTFWKSVKSLLSDKCRLPLNVTLARENDAVSDNGKIADVFNDVFTNAVKNLNIKVSRDILFKANNIKDPVLRTVKKYKKHPSIKAIVSISKNDNFVSEKVSCKETLHEIKQLDTRKTCQDTDVASKIIKINPDIFADFLHQNFNDAIATSVFRQNLKNANIIIPVFKKGYRNSETNYLIGEKKSGKSD